MALSAHRLVDWQRAVLFGAGAVLLASGAAWLALRYGRGTDALPSPLEPWTMRLHGLAAFAALFAFGALAAAHVPQGWRFSHRMRWARQRGSSIWRRPDPAGARLAAQRPRRGDGRPGGEPSPARETAPAPGWLTPPRVASATNRTRPCRSDGNDARKRFK